VDTVRDLYRGVLPNGQFVLVTVYTSGEAEVAFKRPFDTTWEPPIRLEGQAVD